MHLGRDHGGRERGTREAKLPALFVAQIPQAHVSFVDRSGVHGLLLVEIYETSRFRIDTTLRDRPVAYEIATRVPQATNGSADLDLTPRGVSSAGRAPALQAGGHRFDPGTLH